MARAGLPRRRGAGRGAGGAAAHRARRARRFLAPHFVERVPADGAGRAPAHRDDARRGPAAPRCAASWTMHRERLLAHGAHNVAVAVLDNASGEWLAWEGSGDYAGRGPRRRHRRRGRAAPAGLGARSRSRTRWPSSAASRRPPCCPTCPRTSRRRRRASSTARATTTASSAGRCARGAALAGSENVPAVWLLVAGGRARPAAPAAPRRLHHAGQDGRPLRLRAHHGRRRGARWPTWWPPTRRSPAAACTGEPRLVRSGAWPPTAP